jgi:predicted membrane protein
MELLPTIRIYLMSKKTFNTLFVIFAILAALPVIYHCIGIFIKINSSPVWRHILFIIIGIISIYGLLKRPGWFVWFFLVLTIQQLYSHGGDLLWHWNHEQRVDWISIAVLIFMPGVLFFLFLEKRKIFIS